jgi:hypothetical protein
MAGSLSRLPSVPAGQQWQAEVGTQQTLNAARPWENDMSLERMILLVVGLIVVASTVLGVLHSPGWLWVTGIMGLHLVQAAFTGMCPVVAVLKKLGLPERAGFA